MIRGAMLATTLGTLCAFSAASAATPEELLEQIKDVGPEGRGNVEAAAAWKELTGSGPEVLPTVVREFEGANPLAENWIRSAFETIADRAIESGAGLPEKELEAFVRDKKEHPRARRLAYEWLLKVDPTVEERLIGSMLLDPSPEMRRDAVARLIDEAERAKEEGQAKAARAKYEQALQGAVHDDQVKEIVAGLKPFDVTVDLQQHFGFVPEWHVIGPFDNRGGKGFDTAYPPEKEIDLDASYASAYPGADGKVSWQPIETEDEYGIVDVAKQLENHKGSVMYFTTDFTTDEARSVQMRLGTPNAWKLWVNGKEIFGREEYHRGMKLDQYRVQVDLKPGRNVILLKVCQNEQTQDWAQRYQFQFRVCDGAGSAVLPSDRRTSSTEPNTSTSRGAE